MRRILITKPASQQEPWLRALSAAGWTPHSLPLLTLQDLPETPEQRTTWLDLDLFQGVILISPHAARRCAEALDRYWPQPPVGIHWLAPGPGTATTLNAELPTIPVLCPAQGHTSEDLLALPATQQLAGQRWLLVAGEGGREVIADTLEQRGASVTRLALYRRQPVQLTASQQRLLTDLPLIIQLSSRMALESLTSQAPLVTKQEATLLVSSQRLADTALEMGWQRTLQAHGASLDATLDSLATYRTTQS